MGRPVYNPDITGFDIVCYFDGACEPSNPGGHMGAGMVVKCIHTKRTLYSESLAYNAHPSNTNNVAECIALYYTLEFLLSSSLDHKEIVIYGDADLLIKHASGEWTFRHKGGRYHNGMQKVLDTVKKFKSTPEFRWLPREYNTAADELSQYKLSQQGVVRSR